MESISAKMLLFSFNMFQPLSSQSGNTNLSVDLKTPDESGQNALLTVVFYHSASEKKPQTKTCSAPAAAFQVLSWGQLL